jgi:hypothetical protein
VLTIANAAKTNGLTWLPTEKLEIINFGHPSYGMEELDGPAVSSACDRGN